METDTRNLSSIEIRNLMLETLAYEEADIDSEGKTFKMYGYQGAQSDLFRLMEGLAVKRKLIKEKVPLHGAEWGARGFRLHQVSTTNCSRSDRKNTFEHLYL